MAVTINEMEVEATDTSATPSAAPAEPKPGTSLNFQERKLRLEAE